MTKPTALIVAPVDTRSGYGDHSRDFIRQFIEYDKFDVKIISTPWGATPMGVLDETNPYDKQILDRIIKEPLQRQPEVCISILIPNEFHNVGKFNIGLTAGIETTVAPVEWVAGCNKVDLVIATSRHAKDSLEQSTYTNTKTGAIFKVEKPIEVLGGYVDTAELGSNAPMDAELKKQLDGIKEDFCYLFVGHWLQGEFGEDRKNVSLLVKLFLETFKQVTNKPRPALILKTSNAGFSVLDRAAVISKIEMIKSSVTLEEGQELCSIYLIHGDLTKTEMNTLYAHEKVKVNVSLTKGEGFGRPLLEASLYGKPVVASGWSGHLDFLDAERAILISGELKPVHASAANDMILKEASWFAPDHQHAANSMAAPFFEWSKYKKLAYNLALKNKQEFSYATIMKKMAEILNKHIPEFPKTVPIVLPKLKKIVPVTVNETTNTK